MARVPEMVSPSHWLEAAAAPAEAKTLYERYLTLDPPADWAATARTAIAYCAAQLRA